MKSAGAGHLSQRLPSHEKASPGNVVRSIAMAGTSLLIALPLGSCSTQEPVPRSSAGFVVLRTIPSFLDPVPVAHIGRDTAYLAYGPGTRSAPGLVLSESRRPIKSDIEPTNPIQWREPPPNTTKQLLYEAVFKCADLTVDASAFFATFDAAEHAQAQLKVLAAELSARCAELGAPPTVSPG